MAIKINRERYLAARAKTSRKDALDLKVIGFGAFEYWLIVSGLKDELPVVDGIFQEAGEVALYQKTKKELGTRAVKEMREQYNDFKAFNDSQKPDERVTSFPPLEDMQEWDGCIFFKMKYHLRHEDGVSIMVFDDTIQLDRTYIYDDDGYIVPEECEGDE